jgi:hypothetical protein
MAILSIETGVGCVVGDETKRELSKGLRALDEDGEGL